MDKSLLSPSSEMLQLPQSRTGAGFGYPQASHEKGLWELLLTETDSPSTCARCHAKLHRAAKIFHSNSTAPTRPLLQGTQTENSSLFNAAIEGTWRSDQSSLRKQDILGQCWLWCPGCPSNEIRLAGCPPSLFFNRTQSQNLHPPPCPRPLPLELVLQKQHTFARV